MRLECARVLWPHCAALVALFEKPRFKEKGPGAGERYPRRASGARRDSMGVSDTFLWGPGREPASVAFLSSDFAHR